MESKSRLVSIVLPNGHTAQVEASVVDGVDEAGFHAKSFDGVIGAIEGIAQSVQTALAKVKPAKASVEIGLEVMVQSGQLTALLVQGSGKANLKITLSWE